MTKLRILCLHGLAQNKINFGRKTKAITQRVDNFTEFVHVTAPHFILTPEYATISQREESNNIIRTDETKPYCWWYPLRYKKLLSDGTSPGFAESLAYIKQILLEQGPFDGILGFSQGGCMAAILTQLLENRTIFPHWIEPEFQHPPLKFSIFVSAFIPHQQEAFKPLFMQQKKNKSPTLHIIGELDTVVLPESSVNLSFCFQDPVLFKHPGGHFVPSSELAQKKLESFLYPFKKVNDESVLAEEHKL
ncbi:serine hydrolase FSH [Cunninghamella echinulata]|nr:serine hydrolase FSH [Cunninghamella echinulata]